MARAGNLTGYLPLTRRAARPDWRTPLAPRPSGAIVWLHGAREDALAALYQVAVRMDGSGHDPHYLLTTAPGVTAPLPLPPRTILADLPPDNWLDAEHFLSHWQPDVGLWSTGNLRPGLLTVARRRGLRMVLVDADETALEEGRWRWLPDTTRDVVQGFSRVYARTANAGRRLERLGYAPQRIEVSGPLQRSAPALGFDAKEREAVSTAISGRLVWLAIGATAEELETITRAHRQALATTHRLILVIAPRHAEEATTFLDRLRSGGWRVSNWAEGEVPGDATQILLADGCDQMGLWLQVAPVTFLGGSLSPEGGGTDPYAAAALGSAILAGPHMGRHQPLVDRMVREGAARQVRDAGSLAAAVNRLSAPDQAAAQAHAAWAIATEGAEATDAVIALLQDMLDKTADRGA
ncbi:MAG: 3-deoxy-D-manno-octulosonic acid transferase [Pseudooceanicola sp.]